MTKENQGKMENLLKDLGRNIDELIAKSKGGSKEFKADIDARKEELKRNMETLESETKKFIHDKGKWREVEAKLKNAVYELKDAVETAFSVKNEKETW